MGYEHYERLLAWVAQYGGMDEKAFALEPVLRMKGTTLRFEYLERPALCRVSMVLPAMPDDSPAVLRLMLESNAMPGEELLPVLALDPDSGDPLVLLHFPVAPGVEDALGYFFSLGLDIFVSTWRSLWQDEVSESVSALATLA